MRPGEDPRDCWATPPELAKNLIEEFGCTWDAACDNDNCVFPGLVVPPQWDGITSLKTYERPAWCNPPYSDIQPWVSAACLRAGDMFAVTVMLLPVRTGRRWFLSAVEAPALRELSFFWGRIEFLPPPGVEPSSPRFDNMLLVFGPGAGLRVTSRCPKTGKVLASR